MREFFKGLRRIVQCATLMLAHMCMTVCARGDLQDAPKKDVGRSAAVTHFDPADWPMYNHDLAGWRFNSAETKLNPKNVSRLIEEWRFPADSDETIGVVHATPTVVDDHVYFGTATFPAFYKLDADGKLKWIYRNPAGKSVLPPSSGEPVTDKLRAAASEGGIFSSALYADGAVYFGM